MAQVPAELLADSSVSDGAIRAAVAMWSVVSRSESAPTYWRSITALAEQIGCTERQAQRRVQELAARGWVARRQGAKGWETLLFDEPLTGERTVVIDRSQVSAPPTDRSADDAPLAAQRYPHSPLSGTPTDRSVDSEGGGIGKDTKGHEGTRNPPCSPPPGDAPRGHNLEPIVGELEHEPPSLAELAAIDAAARERYGDPADVDAELCEIADACDAEADATLVDNALAASHSAAKSAWQEKSGSKPRLPVVPPDAPTFALTPPPAPGPTTPAKGLGEREAWASGLWDRYEAQRVEATPRARHRGWLPDSEHRRKAHRAIARLVRHVRDAEGLDESAGRARVESYAMGAIAEAAAATGEWGDRVRLWRADGSEWRTKRFDSWAGKQVAGGGGPGPPGRGRVRARGPLIPAEHEHSSEGEFDF